MSRRRRTKEDIGIRDTPEISPLAEPARKPRAVSEDSWRKREEQLERQSLLRTEVEGRTPYERSAARLDIAQERQRAGVKTEEARLTGFEREYGEQKTVAQAILEQPEIYTPESLEAYRGAWEEYSGRAETFIESRRQQIVEAKEITSRPLGQEYLSAVGIAGRESQQERRQLRREALAKYQSELKVAERDYRSKLMTLGRDYQIQRLPSKRRYVKGEEKQDLETYDPLGPKPDSKLAAGIQDVAAKIVGLEEKAFSQIEKSLEEPAKKLWLKAHGAPSRGKPWGGLPAYLGSIGLYGAEAFISGASFVVRPAMWGRTLETLVGLATFTDTPFFTKEEGAMIRGQYAQYILEDPLRFSVQLGGGVVGGYAFGKGLGYVKGKVADFRLKQFHEKYPLEDFLPYEERLRYPEEVTSQKLSSHLYMRRTVQVYDVTQGEPGFLDYYTPGPEVVPDETVALPDLPEGPRTPVLWDFKEGKMSISIDQKPPKPPKTDPVVEITKTKKGLLYRLGEEYGLVRTGHDLIPAILPEGVGESTTISLPGVEVVEDFIPGLRISGAAPEMVKTTSKISGLLGASAILEPPERESGEVVRPISRFLLEPEFVPGLRIKEVVAPAKERADAKLLSFMGALGEVQAPKFTPPATEVVQFPRLREVLGLREKTISKLTPETTPITEIKTTPLLDSALALRLDQITIQRQRQKQTALLLPQLTLRPPPPPPRTPYPLIGLTPPSPPGPPLFPFWEPKKKGGKGWLDLLAFGEMREYPVRLPEEMFGDLLGLPKKKRKRRKKR